MLPKSLGRALQLIALLLLASVILLIIREQLDGWTEVVGFVITTVVIIGAWHKMRFTTTSSNSARLYSLTIPNSRWSRHLPLILR